MKVRAAEGQVSTSPDPVPHRPSTWPEGKSDSCAGCPAQPVPESRKGLAENFTPRLGIWLRAAGLSRPALDIAVRDSEQFGALTQLSSNCTMQREAAPFNSVVRHILNSYDPRLRVGPRHRGERFGAFR
jgi:hypothetical protein